jgi:hypothetical protein
MQLSVSAGPQDPSHIVETYTFTVRYPQSSNSDPPSVILEAPRKQRVTITHARYGMAMVIRRVLLLCEGLPDLPRKI